MARHPRRLYGGVAVIVLLVQAAACGGFPALPQPMADTTRDTLPAVALDTPGQGEALVYVFNVSGWTLLGSDFSVGLDGWEVAHLPRKRYATLGMAAGQHLLLVPGGTLELLVEAGRTYFLACAFIPEESPTWPLGTEDAEVREVDEGTARALLRTYRSEATQRIATAVASQQPMVDTTRNTLPESALERPADGEALVFVFNACGYTLSGRSDVHIDGRKAGDLPRRTYTTFAMVPGKHLWKIGRGRLELTVEAGRTYFLACAYNPWSSWFWTLEGRGEDTELRELNETTARVLLRTYHFQAPSEENRKVAGPVVGDRRSPLPQPEDRDHLPGFRRSRLRT